MRAGADGCENIKQLLRMFYTELDQVTGADGPCITPAYQSDAKVQTNPASRYELIVGYGVQYAMRVFLSVYLQYLLDLIIYIVCRFNLWISH